MPEPEEPGSCEVMILAIIAATGAMGILLVAVALMAGLKSLLE